MAGTVNDVEAAHEAKLHDALYRIAEMASAASDMAEFYAAMHRIVGELMFAKNFYIALYDEERALLNYPYYRDEVDLDVPDPDAWEPMGTGQARGLTAYTLRTGRPQLVPKKRFEELVASGEVDSVGTPGEDWLGVPLRAEGRSIGVVVVQTYEPGQHYSERDVELLTFVGQHIASALTRARAIAQTRQLLAESNQRAAELAIIQAGLAKGLGTQEMYDLVGDKIQEIFDAQVVDIGMVDTSSGLIRFPYTIERGVRFPDEPIEIMGVRKHVLETRQPLLVNERALETAAQYGQASAIQGEIPKSALFAPLVVGGEAKGVISLQNIDREHAFSDADVNLLTTLAGSLSAALENVRLVAEAHEARAEAERHRQELARFLPSTVAELMASPTGSPLLAAHRREITAFFCDLRGFTDFTQAAEPEEVFDLLADYQRLVGQLVLENGGTLEHYAGDGIMAFFNDPKPVADHPLVTTSMAIQVQQRFAEIVRRWERRGFELGLGIGISTGYATVGRVGFEGYYLYAALGSVANLAARLCAMATSGQIVISGRSYAEVEHAVDAQPLGSIELKGFRRPVEAFAVVGLS